MTVDQLDGVHRRYRETSDRFKSAWTFHQFVQGINKVFANQRVQSDQVSFQGIYANLKASAKNLDSASAEDIGEKVDAAARELDDRFRELVSADALLSPSLMRRFFSRVRNYDDRIVTQLLKFYVYTAALEWNDDRRDKADFLLTRLGQDLLGQHEDPLERDPSRFHEVLSGIWKSFGVEDPAVEIVQDKLAEIRSLREAMSRLEGLDQFNQMGLIDAYRSFKQGLGRAMFYPDIATEIAVTNLFLRDAVERFYEQEEQRVASESRRVFELERAAEDVDGGLSEDLVEFRGDVEQLERSIESHNVKIDELVRVRARAEELIPRLERASVDEVSARSALDEGAVDDTPPMPATTHPADGVSDGWAEGLDTERPHETLRIRTAHVGVLGEALRELLVELEQTDWRSDPRAACRGAGVEPFRLDPREVLAYRRLHFTERFEREVEQLLLEGAAVRFEIGRVAERLATTDPEGQSESDTASARDLVRVAAGFEGRFRCLVEEALASRRFEEARCLQRLHMRLLREYSGLWLLLFRG